MRVVSWNVLAPELLQFFWRSSYGLPLVADFDAVTAARVARIAAELRALAPDVLLLQETTDTAHACLGGRTVAAFLAAELALTPASASFTGAPFRYAAPPREQARRL